jgi:phosphohistidine phosphatase
VKLYLMRHAPAEDQAGSGRDFDRELTVSGRGRARDVARALADAGEGPRRILSSPYVRARETAELVAERFEPRPPIETCAELGCGGDALPVVQRLLGEGARRVMLVGHEPDLTELAMRLLPAWRGAFDKAMVLGLRLRDGEPARHRFTLDPKRLVLLGC